MNIIIRCDSSNIIGTGHVMRCLNLCEYYPQHNFTFVCKNFPNNISDKILNLGHKLILQDYFIKPEINKYNTWLGINYIYETNNFIDIIANKIYDIVIFDHYGIDYILETKVRNYCNKVIVISDIFDNFHYCDIFINYNCDCLEKVQNINKNDKTIYKIGLNNIIINKHFLNSAKKEKYNDNIKNIIINMGGADPNNYTLQVLQCINDLIIKNNININIIIGKSNTNLDIITKYISDITQNNNIVNNINSILNIYYDVNFTKLINLYLESDLVIGSLSITAYERLFLKVPQICIKIVENQLIQQLENFNIVEIKNLHDKLIKYKNIVCNISNNITDNIADNISNNIKLILEY